MNIVIPGAAGFVAVNLLRWLDADPAIAERFEKIVLVDPLQYGIQKLPRTFLEGPRYEFIQGSIYDPELLPRVIGKGDVVIHLVAEVNSFTSPQATVADDPVRYLSALAEAEIDRLLFLSTADVYGDNLSADLLETDPVLPTTVYAAAKASFEAYLSAFRAQHGLASVVFRPVTIYGPHQYAGWLVPRVITQAIGNEGITLTGDGSVRRDWIHVDDVCDLLVRAVVADDSVCGEVFNVGTGSEDTVLALTQHVLEHLGRSESLITFVPDRPGDVRRQMTRATRARTAFEWSPAMSLQKGLDSTISWYQSNHQG